MVGVRVRCRRVGIGPRDGARDGTNGGDRGSAARRGRAVGDVVMAAERVRLDDGGFALEWGQPPSHPWVVHYLALGGEELSARVAGPSRQPEHQL